MKNRPQLLSSLALLALLFQSFAPILTALAAPAGQAGTPEARAQALLETLSTEEKIGQLFLVHFDGAETSSGTAIYNLVINHHIGGVVLRADNDNFTGQESTAASALDLIQDLQQIEWLSTQHTITDTVTGEPYTPAYVPLFIGISQPGDGAPYDQLLNDLTQMPSPAAVGATWNTALAERAGLVSGQELSLLGFNLLLGPSLDVLENPNPDSGGDLGVRTFGGDPFWVGRIGGAYIAGLRTGSDGRLAVIGKHFPGVGGSDRPIEEEVSTVRKSLEQLKQIELAPFFYVTGDAPSPEATVDGLLISHIRYQGFLGNIRATTRPVSFDEASFTALMNLEQFADWRGAGGVMISDDLGSLAVRRFFDPSGLSFNARLVVRDAFLAGNDMLYLGDIIDTGDPDTETTVIRILEFFTQKYQEDQVFAGQVDLAVMRILTLKFKLYESFNLADVIPDPAGLSNIGNSQQTVLDITRAGATLISPTFADLENLLPDAPELDDQIVFITDTSPQPQCSDCPAVETLPVDALLKSIVRLYGPESGNQVQGRNLNAYSFFDLAGLLDGITSTTLETNLRNADWIVISLQDVTEDRPESLALRRLLAERDELVRGKHVIVFAFNAPYFLDATEISKTTAYYALYTKAPPAIETAARILFKEFIPSLGASPVSVPGIGYFLFQATSPDPNQVIQVRITNPASGEEEGEELEPPSPAERELGEVLALETSPILDHNGHPVPDGTPVQFLFVLNGIETVTPNVITSGGVARTSYVIDEPGALRIGLLTEPRALVTELNITIPTPEGFIPPTPVTETPEAAPTAENTQTPPEALPTPITEEPAPARTQTDVVDWMIAALVSLTVGLAAYRLGSSMGLSRWSIRWGFSAVIGGLLSYLYLAFGLNGSEWLVANGRSAILWMTAFFALAGWGLSAGWYFVQLKTAPPRRTDPPKIT